jgi:hypothetical protein
LLITPYIWSCRLDFNWYYTWDCASGCFWDVSCLHRIPTPTLPRTSSASTHHTTHTGEEA